MEYGEGADPDQTTREGQAPAASWSFPGGLFPVLFSLPQVMVTNVTSLLKTVKAVEDEATKGTRALEATIEHIRQELAVSAAPRGPPRPPAAPKPHPCASLFSGLLLPGASCPGLHPGGLHPNDERHHHGHGQSCGRRQLVSAGGRHRHGQPEPPRHRGHAARLQGATGMWGWHGAGGQAGALFEPQYGREGVLIQISVPGFQEAAYHPEVSADVRQRALRFGRECADGYLELLEHVLVVSVPGPLSRGLLFLWAL